MTIASMYNKILRRTIVATIFLLFSFCVAAQVTIIGYVYDDKGEPVFGASIAEKDGSGTISDIGGWFKIEVSGNKPLTAVFIGYKPLKINEKENKYVEVTLMPDKSKRESSYIAINAKTYQKACEGDIQSQIEMAEMYTDERGCYTEKKIGWYTEAAKSGNTTAQYELGNLYYNEKDYKNAVHWFKKCAEQEVIPEYDFVNDNFIVSDGIEILNAKYRLGLCYHHGVGVEKNYSEAKQLFTDAANFGSTEAQVALGDFLFVGYNGEKPNYKEAVKWYRLAAEQGNSSGQVNLGDCYYDGLGVKQDYTEAAKWYRKATEQGLAIAQNNLGYCYHNGHGVTKDYTEAVKWYRKSAEQGLAMAQNNLGYCYYYGHGVTKDYTEAVKWYRKSAEQGYVKAQNRLGDCYYFGNGTDVNYKEAVKWYLSAAEQGNAMSQNALGHCYAMGEGVPYDMNEAEKWWTLAANQGNIEAKLALENLEKERKKGINPPQELATLLSGVSTDLSDEDLQKIKDTLHKKKANSSTSDLIEPVILEYTYPDAKKNTSVSPQLKVLSDSKVTFSDTRQEVRFAISDDSQAIKYRIDGSETTTLSTQAVKAGVCEIELPQRNCLLTMWCVGGEPHTIQYIYDSEKSARKSATLHILAIGLNDYQDPNLGDLNYAENDAHDVIAAIQKKHKHTFANIDAQLLVGRDVTSEKITEKINNLADNASASDLAVIFFAGHGLVDERDRYYLSTYNITNADTPRRGGYSASQFIEDISYIDCKLLVFIDACYSGKLLEGYRGTVSSENFFREMSNTPNGTCIYTSSNKDVKSKELSQFKHGVFTQALIESFEFENSDTDEDNRISVTEVRNYLEKRIPQLTQNKQKPIYRNVEEIDFPLFIK